MTERRQPVTDELGREKRYVTSGMEVRADKSGVVTFEGLASRTNTPYDMGWYDETIARGAFAATLAANPDVQLLVNHGGLPLARTANGSLDLRETDSGLEFTARCADSDPDVQSLRSKVQSGLMDQCSFAFRVTAQKWTWADEELSADGKPADRDRREIKAVDLQRGDVSICNYGANPHTPVTARSLGLDLLPAAELDALLDDPRIVRAIRARGYHLRDSYDEFGATPEGRAALDKARAEYEAEVRALATPEPQLGNVLTVEMARARAWAMRRKYRK